MRMLVLFYFHQLGYTPVEVALLFLFYEFFGIVTNLVGGWLAARLGLKATLFVGLAMQVVALGMLGLDAGAPGSSVAYVMVAQALSGIAKDLTKMSSKSAVKLLVPEDAPVDALQVGRDPDRLEERAQGRRLLPRRPAADACSASSRRC